MLHPSPTHKQYVDPMRILHRSLSSAGSTAPGERRASVATPLNLYKCDVFSFGCVLWAMVERAEPHAGKEPESLVQRYEVDPYFRLPLPGVSIGFKSEGWEGRGECLPDRVCRCS